MDPFGDGNVEIGSSNRRLANVHLQLPNNTTPALVVVNKGGTGLDKLSGLGYVVGYASESEQIKQMGACVVSIRGGIIMNVTGC
jgi:hypothetical protein